MAPCLFLNQLLLPPLKVYLLHEKNELASPQNPVDVKGTPTTGCGSAQPSPIVLMDSLSSVALGDAFHMHPPYSAHKGHQIIFLCREGAHTAIQLPLLVEELLLQLNGHH
jgi:hypothetical protein